MFTILVRWGLGKGQPNILIFIIFFGLLDGLTFIYSPITSTGVNILNSIPPVPKDLQYIYNQSHKIQYDTTHTHLLVWKTKKIILTLVSGQDKYLSPDKAIYAGLLVYMVLTRVNPRNFCCSYDLIVNPEKSRLINHSNSMMC